ncbi:MAG: SpoIIE family protein phosphatase, partial [Clostridia bacterium]|nr:SpoIIE family protein phosphatase [Clostridia bacterium]
KNVTLEMLNTFLMSKTDETFTTVDLLEIDLLSAQACFIKAGAAPSYVLRSDRLHRIESHTPPAGILGKMCAEQTSFSLREGDFVILISDGVDWEEGSFASNFVGKKFETAAELCDHLFSSVKEKGAARDDLSISVIRIVNDR